MTLDLIIEAEAWKLNAACRDADSSLFFLEPHGPGKHGSPRAKAICATCTVTSECLDYANRTMQAFGIWGGLTPRERKRVRARSLANARETKSAKEHQWSQ